MPHNITNDRGFPNFNASLLRNKHTSNRFTSNALGALVPCEKKMSLAGDWKQLRWSSDCGQDPEDCSRWTDQQWKKTQKARRSYVMSRWLIALFIKHTEWIRSRDSQLDDNSILQRFRADSIWLSQWFSTGGPRNLEFRERQPEVPPVASEEMKNSGRNRQAPRLAAQISHVNVCYC